MKISYQDSIVAFVDVLGFSRIVYGSDKSHIEAYFTYVVDDLKGQVGSTGFQYLLISDAIVVSAPNTLTNLTGLVKLLSKIQAKLLSRGILTRGGIASGDLHVDRDSSVVVGPGLIRAYELERAANYPRIIIDRRFIPLYQTGTQRLIAEFGEWLACDDVEKYADGAIYINYPRYVVIHNTFYLNNRMADILAMFKEEYYGNEHFAKYDWLLRHLVIQFTRSLDEGALQSNQTRQTKTKLRKIRDVLPRFSEL